MHIHQSENPRRVLGTGFSNVGVSLMNHACPKDKSKLGALSLPNNQNLQENCHVRILAGVKIEFRF
jgi:hypothetical protein